MQYNDIFTIQATASAGNKVGYYSYPNEAGADDIDISSNTYEKAVFRYKTSDDNIKAKIVLVFSSGTQTILDETSETEWTYGTEDITSGKTIDHVRLYANQATGYVYYDFLLLHEDTFTFPQVDRILPLHLHNEYARIKPPGRVGNIKQYIGMESPTIRLEGPMDTNTSWGTPDGEILYRIFHEAHTDPWQWFTSDLINCKIVPVDFDISQQTGETGFQRNWTLDLEMYSLSSGDETTWSELQWLGI